MPPPDPAIPSLAHPETCGNAVRSEPVGKTVCLLSMSAVADDPRVRRQGDALAQAGWTVMSLGLPGARSPAPAWPCYHVNSPFRLDGRSESGDHHASLQGRWISRSTIASVVRRGRLALLMAMSRVRPEMAFAAYWGRPAVRQMYEASRDLRADLWVANDWTMLPLAARLSKERGGAFVYDTHEFAINEFLERWKWRTFNRPMVEVIEATHIRTARVVSTVSGGIADALQATYDLPVRPLVVRNVPAFQSHQGAETSCPVRILYHGIVAPVRGLEALVRSVRDWRPEFELTIRGPGNQLYIDSLKRMIEVEGVGARVKLVPAVPMTDLVKEAAQFDVGFFCMPRLSQQHEYVLPNKLFEYIMAGLAICVSDLPEMSQIVRSTGVGVLLPSAEPRDIARTINGLTVDAIRAFRARSREVARDLCWEKESLAMIASYSAAVGSP